MTTTELPLDSPDHLPTTTAPYWVGIATRRVDVLAAQRLRDEIFTVENGAVTPGPPGLDRDQFDGRCDHLVVWRGSVDNPREVVATYRLLPPHRNQARPRGQGLYAHQEFQLDRLERLLALTVEAGRACVHPDHRGGAVISLLWKAIHRYMVKSGHRYLMGCASVSALDGGANGAAVWDLIRRDHLAARSQRCQPHSPFEFADAARGLRPAVPALLRGYLRLGAVACGPPAVDPVFRTVDFLMLLDLRSANDRYLRYLDQVAV